MWLHRNYRPKPFSSSSKQDKNVSIGKHINRPFILVSVLGEGNFLRCYLNKAIQGLVFSSLISTMLILVRLKLEHESSRIHFRGLSVLRVYEEADAEERCSQRDFLHIPCCLLPLPKILNMHFPKWAVLRDTWAEYKTISDVFIMPYDVTVCVFISWITSKMAHELCVFWTQFLMFVKGVVKVLMPAFLVTL